MLEVHLLFRGEEEVGELLGVGVDDAHDGEALEGGVEQVVEPAPHEGRGEEAHDEGEDDREREPEEGGAPGEEPGGGLAFGGPAHEPAGAPLEGVPDRHAHAPVEEVEDEVEDESRQDQRQEGHQAPREELLHTPPLFHTAGPPGYPFTHPMGLRRATF